MKRISQVAVLCLGLMLGLVLPAIVSASGPENGLGQESGHIIGVASNALKCLAVGSNVPAQASGVVNLTWQGQIDQARLVLSISGTEAEHTIKVNGQSVTLAPIYPDGQPCSNGQYFYLDVPPEVLVQGGNLIEITDDALANDSWTAAYVRLEVFGDITVLPASEPDKIEQIGAADITAAATSFVISFTNPYDGSSQEATAQIPDGYDGNTPTPLVIVVHGRNSIMEWGTDYFGDAANDKNWLLASPQMHGSWPIPEVCYTDPSDPGCQTDDEFLLDRPGAYAHASLESQYDIIGTVQYMVNNYNVKYDRIYLTGESMGGQIDTITAAKFPHLFAAVFDNKGITDMAQWWSERSSSTKRTLEKECHIGGDRKTPSKNSFCYERRTSLNFARNYIHIPISMTHSISDQLVPITHSWRLRDAINNYEPDQEASVFEENGGNDGGAACSYHCYDPDPMAVLNFLEPFTLNNTPTHINISTDESKSYYWLNFAQTDGDHWSQVEVTYFPISSTVTATISDTKPLSVAFNLGSIPITEVIPHPGMGLPATTYLVREVGNYSTLSDYTSGYLTVTLNNTGQFSLTISAIEAEVSANSTLIEANGTATSTVMVTATDQLGNPVPDNTEVEFSTTIGAFPNETLTDTATITGGMGQAMIILTSGATAGQADIVARIGDVTNSTSITITAIPLTITVSASPATISANGTATSTLTAVVEDMWGAPFPDNTAVEFSTTMGTFPNETLTDTATITGGMGQAMIIMTSGVVTGQADIVAHVAGVTSSSTSVTITITNQKTYLPIVIKNN